VFTRPGPPQAQPVIRLPAGSQLWHESPCIFVCLEIDQRETHSQSTFCVLSRCTKSGHHCKERHTGTPMAPSPESPLPLSALGMSCTPISVYAFASLNTLFAIRAFIRPCETRFAHIANTGERVMSKSRCILQDSSQPRCESCSPLSHHTVGIIALAHAEKCTRLPMGLPGCAR
jgi:hypothetical protein